MPSTDTEAVKKDHTEVPNCGCVINYTDEQELQKYCEQLEQSIQELSCAIEMRRIKRLEKQQTKRD